MRKFLLLLFCTALLHCVSSEARACTCSVEVMFPGETEAQRIERDKRRIKDALSEARAVFSGKILKIKRGIPTDADAAPPVQVTFKVSKVWKNVKTEKVIVMTDRDIYGMCGMPFEVGESYLVYACEWKEADGLGTGQCTRTIEMSLAEDDLKVSGEGKALKRAKR